MALALMNCEIPLEVTTISYKPLNIFSFFKYKYCKYSFVFTF